jgi:CDP-diacylglycerol--serine O-phosphatidyltransferase
VLSFLVPQAVTASRVVLGAIALLAAIAGRDALSATLITLGAVTDMVDGPLARALGVRSDFGARFDSFADYLCYVVAPVVLSRSILAAPEPVLSTILVTLPLLAGAARYSRNLGQRSETFAVAGIPGLATVFYAFLIVGFEFARPDSLLGPRPAAVVLGAAVVFASTMMVAPVRYPKVTARKAVLAAVAIALVLMPFVFTRPLAACMLVLGTIYAFVPLARRPRRLPGRS